MVATDTHRLHMVGSHLAVTVNPPTLIPVHPTTNLDASTYCNWRRVVPDAFDHKASFEATALRSALKGLMAIKPDVHRVRFSIDGHTLTMVATCGKTSNGSSVMMTAVIDALDNEATFEFSLNGRFVLDAIEESPDHYSKRAPYIITIHANSCKTPVKFAHPEATQRFAIIMTMANGY